MLGLGDVVKFMWSDGYADGTVCQVNPDGTVDVFRPYTLAPDCSYGASNGGEYVICYVGTEVSRNVDPKRLQLLMKARTPMKAILVNSSAILRWMNKQAPRFRDPLTGELDRTGLVEAWDRAEDTGKATLHPSHPAWDLALEVT